MEWIWQKKNWPNYIFDAQKIADLEIQFHRNAGKLIGAIQHFNKGNFDILKVELLSQEAISTSNIEGEILNRDSVISSLRRHLGLKSDFRKVPANAAGVAEMMVDLYKNFESNLSHESLFEWHSMLMNGRRDVEIIGNYRQHQEPMQIVSGNFNSPKIFFEAPPSNIVQSEMEQFLNWYSEKLNDNNYSILIFASIAHLYFEIIHPFEDGNGRIGRALVEKAISQKLNSPSFNSLAKVIDSNKKEYYSMIQKCNYNLEIDSYIEYFAKLIVKSQEYSIELINFLIFKVQFFAIYDSKINIRQEKVLLRIFDEGIEGFIGGLSAQNYKTITSASNATVTRDLQALVNIQAFTKTGELRHTRYFLNRDI